MILNSWDKHRDMGLLILRLGIGIMFMVHGWPKISGGVDMWTGLGGAMGSFGITFAPAFWGFMAAFSEFGGGLLLALGLFTRPACGLLTVTMVVAASMHLNKGDGIAGSSHAIEAGILFLSLLLIGPGKYSLDEKFTKS